MKRHITTLCVGGVLAFALFGVAMAGPLEDGQAAYQRGDYAEAMRLLRPLAERADARAQTDLGLMYDNGRGVLKDYGQALAWYIAHSVPDGTYPTQTAVRSQSHRHCGFVRPSSTWALLRKRRWMSGSGCGASVLGNTRRRSGTMRSTARCCRS